MKKKLTLLSFCLVTLLLLGLSPPLSYTQEQEITLNTPFGKIEYFSKEDGEFHFNITQNGDWVTGVIKFALDTEKGEGHATIALSTNNKAKYFEGAKVVWTELERKNKTGTVTKEGDLSDGQEVISVEQNKIPASGVPVSIHIDNKVFSFITMVKKENQKVYIEYKGIGLEVIKETGNHTLTGDMLGITWNSWEGQAINTIMHKTVTFSTESYLIEDLPQVFFKIHRVDGLVMDVVTMPELGPITYMIDEGGLSWGFWDPDNGKFFTSLYLRFTSPYLDERGYEGIAHDSLWGNYSEVERSLILKGSGWFEIVPKGTPMSLSPGLISLVEMVRGRVPWTTSFVGASTGNWTPTLQWTLNGQPITGNTYVFQQAGTYDFTLRAEQPPMSLEFTTEDIIITPRVGDINADGKVNILDIAIVAKAFGSYPGHPEWNPIADIAEPFGVINILDIALVAKEFGKTY